MSIGAPSLGTSLGGGLYIFYLNKLSNFTLKKKKEMSVEDNEHIEDNGCFRNFN
jgi:DUF917 family protein